jgi:YD repeat-containing protein
MEEELLFEHRFPAFDLTGDLKKPQLVGEIGALAYEFDLKGQKELLKSACFYQRLKELPQMDLFAEPGEALLAYSSEYDLLGRLRMEKNAQYKIEYQYDALSRLMSRRIFLRTAEKDKLQSCELYLYWESREIGLWNPEESFLKLKAEGDFQQREIEMALEKINPGAF